MALVIVFKSSFLLFGRFTVAKVYVESSFQSLSLNDLRAKVLVVCLDTPALWLNLADSMNILIKHFGLLLKERTIDSIGHDLWKKYNVICLLWMIRYISLLTNIFTQWILMDA